MLVKESPLSLLCHGILEKPVLVTLQDIFYDVLL
jgi:hypothetical protein